MFMIRLMIFALTHLHKCEHNAKTNPNPNKH